MPGSRLEAVVGAMVARARLYERVVHSARPWSMVAQGSTRAGCLMERHELPDRVVLNGYLDTPCEQVTAVEIWCGEDLLACWPVDPPRDAPIRITLDLGIEDAELAA